MTPAATGQGRERKARLPPRQTGFAVPVGVRLPLSRWPCWWACQCPSATRSTHGPPVGVRGAGGPTPWAGGLPGVRAGAGGPTPEPVRLPGVRVGFRWAVPWAGCLPGGRAGAGGPTCGAMCVLGARGRAPTPEPVAVLVGVSGARVPPDRRTARPWVCWVLAGLPVGRWPAWCACRVPVGGAVGRVPTWWPCWCWRAYPWGRVRVGCPWACAYP